MKAFLSFSISFTIVSGLTFTIYYGEVIIPFKYSAKGGFWVGCLFGLLVILERILFKKRIFSYSNIDAELEARGVSNIIYEENAVNADVIRTRLGGLFLTSEAVLFIPGRFAFKPRRFIILPLERIKQVGKAPTNPLKFFFDVLRRRLSIETNQGERYEFLVWELNKWIEKIKKAKNQVE
jgi:hypothetical protein